MLSVVEIGAHAEGILDTAVVIAVDALVICAGVGVYTGVVVFFVSVTASTGFFFLPVIFIYSARALESELFIISFVRSVGRLLIHHALHHLFLPSESLPRGIIGAFFSILPHSSSTFLAIHDVSSLDLSAAITTNHINPIPKRFMIVHEK